MRSVRGALALSSLLFCLAACAGVPVEDVATSEQALTQQQIFAPNAILDVRLEIDPAGLDSLRTAPRTYVPANIVIAGQRFAGEVKLKGGAGSFRKLDEKAAFKVKFAKDSRPAGLKKLTLNNMVQDPSMIHEQLAYRVYEAMGVPSSRTSYARVVVNDTLYGLYANIETVDDVMLSRYFDDTTGVLYENGLGMRAELRTSDIDRFDLAEGDDDDHAALKELIAAVDAPGDDVLYGPNARIDAASFVRYMAAAIAISDSDGYVFYTNNFRIYRDPRSQRWSFIPSGLDQTLSFGWYSPAFMGVGLVAKKCLASERCLAELDAAVSEALSTFASLRLLEKAEQKWSLIQTAAAEDPRKPYDAAAMLAKYQDAKKFIETQPALVAIATECMRTATPLQTCSGSELVHVESGNCADVKGSRQSDGVILHPYGCHGGNNQRVQLLERAGGYARMVIRQSGRCVAVTDERTGEEGFPVVQWRCHDGDDQLWRTEPVPGGVRIVAKRSGQCLSNGSTRLMTTTCTDGDSRQVWQVRPWSS